jgi:RHS repeat-associated protein
LLLDSSGNITDRYSYDAWGNPIEQTGTTFNPFRWNGAYGYEYIPATGLYHVGAREYDPRTGRWLQRDPIGAASGDPNLYRYCGNDPINAADPSGLDWLDDAANFFAGWGDTLTFGLTGTIRRWLGLDDVVDRCSGGYQGG